MNENSLYQAFIDFSRFISKNRRELPPEECQLCAATSYLAGKPTLCDLHLVDQAAAQVISEKGGEDHVSQGDRLRPGNP